LQGSLLASARNDIGIFRFCQCFDGMENKKWTFLPPYFVILTVNAGDSANQAAAFANQKGLAFPVLLDPNTKFLASLSVRSFPTSILVGSDGVVKAIRVSMFTPQFKDKS
jgi:hypothetical protein